jgi:hypothetical protein
MNIPNGKWRVMVRRLLGMVGGVTAAGPGLLSLASAGQVFAHQFLKDATPMEIPEMVYSPEQQLMVKPGTGIPVFRYSRSLLRGGEYQTFPLVTCPGDPSCPSPPPPPTNTVTPGGGPNGPGPTPDHD